MPHKDEQPHLLTGDRLALRGDADQGYEPGTTNMAKTRQEDFWMGEFGDSYCVRNQPKEQTITERRFMFSKMLGSSEAIASGLELGANVGINMRALRSLAPEMELAAVEINAQGVEQLNLIQGLQVFHQSILDFTPQRRWDLCFTCGVLIHMPPDWLPSIYRKLHLASSRYILCSEYYNPTPVEISYRGHAGVLFKRDFAGEMLDMFSDLRLVDSGFFYRRTIPAGDDMTWFLMEKT